jgi:hypothetical protein
VLTKDKVELLLKQQSSIARKVFDSVPIEQSWTVSFIMNDMARRGISAKEPKTVTGCLNTLMSCGLVCEPSTGKFVRTKTKEEYVPPKEKVLPTPKAVKEIDVIATPLIKVEKSDPSQLIADIAIRLMEISSQLQAVTKDAEKFVSEADRWMAEKESEYESLRNLKQLLKGLSA